MSSESEDKHLPDDVLEAASQLIPQKYEVTYTHFKE